MKRNAHAIERYAFVGRQPVRAIRRIRAGAFGYQAAHCSASLSKDGQSERRAPQFIENCVETGAAALTGARLPVETNIPRVPSASCSGTPTNGLPLVDQDCEIDRIVIRQPPHRRSFAANLSQSKTSWE
jgi:hypothetical protein